VLSSLLLQLLKSPLLPLQPLLSLAPLSLALALLPFLILSQLPLL
jgi:hypothetical protein